MDTRWFPSLPCTDGCGFWLGGRAVRAVVCRQAVRIAVHAAALIVGVLSVAAVHTFNRSASAGLVLHFGQAQQW